MTYLSLRDLAILRSDPSEIVKVYAAYKDEFQLAAGIRGRPEALSVAAFCTVAAYDLVPYGSSNGAVTLASLLAQDV